MNEHSVQVVISEPGGRQVRVSWQGTAPAHPLVLQVATVAPLAPPRHEFFPAVAAVSAPPSAPPGISLELRWSEPAPPAPAHEAPRSEPAPLAAAWAAERLRQRHQATATPPARRRVGRAAGG
jgi:hypothetical protein